jgi:hypothetical protein
MSQVGRAADLLIHLWVQVTNKKIGLNNKKATIYFLHGYTISGILAGKYSYIQLLAILGCLLHFNGLAIQFDHVQHLHVACKKKPEMKTRQLRHSVKHWLLFFDLNGIFAVFLRSELYETEALVLGGHLEHIERDH